MSRVESLSTRLLRPWRGVHACVMLSAAASVAGGCNEMVESMRERLGQPSDGVGAAAAGEAEVTRLAFDLVPGVSVQVDDGEVGAPPTEATEIVAGEHMITARHRCGRESTITVVVGEGDTKTLGHGDFPGMATATLRLQISALHGQPLAPTLRTGLADDGAAVADIEHPIGEGGEVTLLACRQRVVVGSGHPDVGGYREDLDVDAGAVIERTLVLAPDAVSAK